MGPSPIRPTAPGLYVVQRAIRKASAVVESFGVQSRWKWAAAAPYANRLAGAEFEVRPGPSIRLVGRFDGPDLRARPASLRALPFASARLARRRLSASCR